MRIIFDNRFQVLCAIFALLLPFIGMVIAPSQPGDLTTNTEVLSASMGIACLVPFFLSKALIAQKKHDGFGAICLLLVALMWVCISIYAVVSLWQ